MYWVGRRTRKRTTKTIDEIDDADNDYQLCGGASSYIATLVRFQLSGNQSQAM